LDANGDLLKTLFLERGLVSLALHYLKGAFPPVTSAGAAALEIRSVAEFTKALLLPSVPIALGVLTGLANGHAAIQGLMDREGILPLLHALEGVSSEQKEIRAKAEGLLDIVSDEASGGVLGGSVKGLRQATKDELRVRAMKRREAMLKGLGMASAVTSDGAERIVVSAKPKIEGLDDMEEEGEDSLSCMVCREGYKLKTTECLGTYTFSKRVNGGAMLGSRSEYIYTTVSHFNVIHFTCHQEAKRADAKLKAPKKEWEGAALRNSETLTNSIFPLRGPAVSSQNYSRYCDQYWENLSTLGRSDGSRFKLLAHDLASLLGRFASGGSFSVDSHGGGKESNSQLLPFMVQMGAYLLEQVGSTQRRALRKSLQAYLGVPESSRTPGVWTPVSGSRRGSFAGMVFFAGSEIFCWFIAFLFFWVGDSIFCFEIRC
jgi:E3 ubiquitin-protein ligase UBR4